MFCSNCGKEIPDGSRFCEYCGTACGAPQQSEPVKNESAPAQAPAYQAAPAYTAPVEGASQPAGEKPKKKGKGGKIAIIIAAVLALGAAAAAGCMFLFGGKNLENTVHKTFDKPKDYYSYVEKKTLSTISEGLKSDEVKSIVDKLENSDDYSMKETVKLKLGSRGKEYTALAKAMGVDLSWLESAGISYTGAMQQEQLMVKVAPILNDVELLNGVFLMDVKKGEMFLGLPEIADKYLAFSFGDDYDYERIQKKMDQMIGAYSNMIKAYPDPEKISGLVNKYYELIMDNIEDVQKTKGTLEAGEVSMECTVLTIELDSKGIQKVLKAVLTEASKDKDIKEIIINFYDSLYDSMKELGSVDEEDFDSEKLYEEFQEAIEDAIDDLDDVGIDKFVMENYVDASGEIVGRTISIKVDKETMTIVYANLKKGGDTGFELTCKTKETSFSLTGGGKEKDNVFNGEYLITVDKKKIMTIGLEDYDVKAAKEGNAKGTIILKPGKDLPVEDAMEELADAIKVPGAASLIAGMKPGLKITLDVTTDHHKIDLALMDDKDELLIISFEGSIEKAEEIKMPSDYVMIDSDGNYDKKELESLVKSIDVDGVLDALEEAGLPDEWLGILRANKDGIIKNLLRELQ